MSAEVEGVVKELLVTEFKVDEDKIGSGATFREMGLDSLDVVSLAMALEDRLSLDTMDRARIGCVIGTGIGGIGAFEDQARIFAERGPSRVSPRLVAMMIP